MADSYGLPNLVHVSLNIIRIEGINSSLEDTRQAEGMVLEALRPLEEKACFSIYNSGKQTAKKLKEIYWGLTEPADKKLISRSSSEQVGLARYNISVLQTEHQEWTDKKRDTPTFIHSHELI